MDQHILASGFGETAGEQGKDKNDFEI